MWNRTKKEHAKLNKANRIDIYKTLTVWAAIGGVGPIGFFLNHNILHTPQPISRTFTGYERDQAPMGDYYETYDYQFASPGDLSSNITGFILGVFAAIAVALLFYCIARFIADPIMHRIDMRTEACSPKQIWLKMFVMTLVVILYCGTMVFAAEYEAYPEEQYIWLSDGRGNEYRVNKQEYEKYSQKKELDEEHVNSDADYNIGPEEKNETKAEEDTEKTPVERGYPSNDLEYYIDHPNEPVPQELAEELMAPDSYNPGMDYNGYTY